MFCTNCGAMIRDGAKFCENCGTRLVILPESQVQQAAQPEAAAGAAAAPETAPAPEPAPQTGSFNQPEPEPEPAPQTGSYTQPEPAPEPAPETGSYTQSEPAPEPAPQTGSYTQSEPAPGPAPQTGQYGQGGPFQQKPAGSRSFSEKLLKLINPGMKMSGMSIAAIVLCILGANLLGALLGIIDIYRDRTNHQYTHWLSAAAIAVFLIFFILGLFGR